MELGFYHILKAEYDSSMLYLLQAEEMVNELGNDSLLLDINTFKGLVYIETFDYFSAIEVYKRVSKLAEKLNRKEDILGGQHMVGEIYKRCKEYDRALEYFEAGKPPIYQKDTIVERHGWWHLNIGEVYFLKEDYEKANNHYEKAMEIWNQLDMVRGKGYTYNQFGDLHLKMKTEDGVEYYKKAIQCNTLMNNKSELVRSQIGLGNFYLDIEKDLELATENFKSALDLGVKNDLAHILVPALDFFIENEKARSNLNITYHELLKIRIDAAEKSLKEISNKDLKIAEAMEKVRVAELRSSQFQKMIFLLLAFILISTIFVIIVNIKNKRLQEARKEVEFQNQVIFQQADELQEANKLLISNNLILEKDLSMNNLALVHSKKIIANIREISKGEKSKKIDSIIRSEIDESYWNELKLVNSYRDKILVKKLSEMYPKLSFKEITLCCMIKMGLSTKEISNITYQNASSLKVARSRIRKKMGLTRIQNMSVFLNNL